jgi:capsular polysaccharide biosynthesis protein
MTKLSLSRQPAIRLSSNDGIEKIHLSSLKILEEVGVMIQSDNALKLLDVAAADIDASKKIARIPHHSDHKPARLPLPVRAVLLAGLLQIAGQDVPHCFS